MFTLKFETNNAAFDDDFEGEVARILREAAHQIKQYGAREQLVRDIDGHVVGRFKLSREEG